MGSVWVGLGCVGSFGFSFFGLGLLGRCMFGLNSLVSSFWCVVLYLFGSGRVGMCWFSAGMVWMMLC